MPADPTLKPVPSDDEHASHQKINALYYGLAGAPADPALMPNPTDYHTSSLQKINQLLWDIADAGAGPGGGIGEAPVDNQRYARMNAAWSMLTAPIALAYGYFAATAIPSGGVWTVINTQVGAGGVVGNPNAAEAVPNGIRLLVNAIVIVNIWAEINVAGLTAKHLAIQLDKQRGTPNPAQIYIRNQAAFAENFGSVTYVGTLIPQDIVQAVAMSDAPINVEATGSASVLIVPM